MRLDQFTDNAQEVFQVAQEIMREQYHTQLDVEHIFLAMLRQHNGLTGRILEHLGIDTEVISQRLEHSLAKTPKVYGQYGYGNQVYITPRTQRLVKRAEEEATRLNDQYVGNDHLLVAISAEREGICSDILNVFGIDQDSIRKALMNIDKTDSSSSRKKLLDDSSETVQQYFADAQEVMHHQQHTQLDIEHIFLIMLRHNNGLTSEILRILNIDSKQIADRVEHELNTRPKNQGNFATGNQVYITPRIQVMIKQARLYASDFGEQYYGVQHLLLAISNDISGSSGGILMSFGVDQQRIRQALLEMQDRQVSTYNTKKPLLDQCTTRVQEIFRVAYDIVMAQHHETVDIEHIFLAMVRQRHGRVARVLRHLNVDIMELTRQIERDLMHYSKAPDQHDYDSAMMYVNQRVRRVVEFARVEADRLRVQQTDIDHLLIAICNDGSSASARILTTYNVDQERIYQALFKTSREYSTHLDAPVTTLLYSRQGPWTRALAWWQYAAGGAPVLPLSLVADLGILLSGEAGTVIGQETDGLEHYATFLRAAVATPVMRAVQTIKLGDLAITAVIAHLAHDAPVPSVYRLPAGFSVADAAGILGSELASYHTHALADAPAILLPADLLDHLLTRLRALTLSDVQFLQAFGPGALGAANLADLRALTELLSLPPLTHDLLDKVLDFLPALAEAAAGSASQIYAIDGISGLANRGSLDTVLPSEWALPEELLSYRFLNRELLYYGHERPLERRNTLLLLLIQGGDAMAGDADLLARMSALVLAKAAAARGATVQCAWFDARLHPPQGLARPQEIAALVQHTSYGRVDLPRALMAVQAHVRVLIDAYARIEVQWLLHTHCGADQVGVVREQARRLHGQVGVSALFLCAGETPQAPPLLAGVLASRWAVLGSAALHDVNQRTQAARVLRRLAPWHTRTNAV